MLVAGGASAQRFPDHPTIAMNGITYTPQSLAARDLGAPGDKTAPFPAHKVIGNVYYVGTRSLSSFLIVTKDGSILINSSYEQNVPNIRASVEQLGFRFSEIKIVLGSNAHDQHQEGNALVKSLTGARVIAVAADVPALRGLTPGGKEHPVDADQRSAHTEGSHERREQLPRGVIAPKLCQSSRYRSRCSSSRHWRTRS
jgi:metallo-beta-lactamase class B